MTYFETKLRRIWNTDDQRMQGPTGPPGTCQVGRLVRRRVGRHDAVSLNVEGMDGRKGTLAREGWLYLNKIFSAALEFL